MYLGKRKFYNPEESEKTRSELIKTKAGAVANMFIELEGLINISQLSEQYFERSHSWLSQKIHGSTVYDKKRGFTNEEYRKLSESLRHIATRLNAHADEIDNASNDEIGMK